MQPITLTKEEAIEALKELRDLIRPVSERYEFALNMSIMAIIDSKEKEIKENDRKRTD